VLCLPADDHQRLTALASELAASPCSVWIAPDYFAILLYGSQTEVLAGIPLVSIKAPTLTGYQRFMKRAFDLVLGALTLVLALPVMLLAAVAIRLDSPGPAIFRQQRVGENGRLFWTLKLRTMFVGAEEQLGQVVQTDENGRLIHKRPNDVRATRVGRVLRRTSIDELPQLVNVLRGEMSLVGPRPELPTLVETYEPWQRQRFAVPPGITGWWQVSGRGDKPMHLNTEYDLHYVRNYSLWLDLKILLMTVGAVITGRGAY
jgi:exopolysaccharide biosynthesis polyprenyl glycosylphosphotransferase